VQQFGITSSNSFLLFVWRNMTFVQRFKTILFLLIWFLLIGGTFIPVPVQPHQDMMPVRIGVLAKRGQAKVLERWNATAVYLSQRSPAYHFEIVPLGFDQIFSSVENREVDFVLANSAYYAALERNYGVKAIATMENRRLGETLTSFGGVIFSRADRDDLHGHGDFDDKSFLAVDEKSFGGYYMAWFHLLQYGFDLHKQFAAVDFAGTHDAVVYGILHGKADIGTVRTDTLERMAAEGKIKLDDFKVFQHRGESSFPFPFLITTDVYPEWPMARLHHVDDKLANIVASGLISISSGDQAARTAHINGWVKPLDYLPVHECLMGLRVDPYTDLDTLSLAKIVQRYRHIIIMVVLVVVFCSVILFFLNQARRKLKRELLHKKKTEKQLSQFKTTLDQIHDCVFIFDPDTLLFSYVNQGGVNQVGYSRDELLTMTPLDMMLEYSEEVFREMLVSLQDGSTDLVSFETGHWHKDGYLVPVYVHLQYVSQAEEQGRFVAVVRDMTAQKAEAEQFRRLFESSMDAIMITGSQGFIDCNQRTLEMFGYARKSDFLKLHPADVSPPIQPNGISSFEMVNEKIKEAMENRVALFDWMHQRKDGSVFPAEVMLSPFERDGETVLHGVVRDVAERRNAEKEKGKLQAKLLHAQKLEAVGQLAAGIAHEINTPTQYVANNITFLSEVIDDVQEIVEQFVQLIAFAKENKALTPEQISQAEELLEDVGWDELATEIPDAINQSMEGLQRVTSIVQAMKEFSHPGSREKADTDINQVITTTVTVARNEWKYVADLETRLDPDLPLIPCLADEIGQVILNMIVNGTHAIAEKLGENSTEKGQIVLQTSHDETGVEIRITDTGAGIPEEILPRIFDPFFTTKKVGKGTGQGLAISHDVITEKHKGSLTCESRVGNGTTFIIRLPLE
jgi:PAS domain S-box-containing protein